VSVFPVPVEAKVTVWPETGLSLESLRVAVSVRLVEPSAVRAEGVETVKVE
jgi:hypothetical protein